MKVLLDEVMPHGLRFGLSGHDVFTTTTHQGWDSVRNGRLLEKAEQAGFEVLITADQNMKYQQNMSGRALGLVVLSTPSWRRIKPRTFSVADAVNLCTPGSIIPVEI